MSFKPFKKLALASALALSFMFNSVARAEEAPAVPPSAPEQTSVECQPWSPITLEIKQGCYINDQGDKYYYRDNALHREDGPAIVRSHPSQGVAHSEGRRPPSYSKTRYEGNREWYWEGRHHRIDGPAVESDDGYKAYYRNGLLHREDGPAVEWPNGNKSYYLNGGMPLSEEEFLARTVKSFNSPKGPIFLPG